MHITHAPQSNLTTPHQQPNETPLPPFLRKQRHLLRRRHHDPHRREPQHGRGALCRRGRGGRRLPRRGRDDQDRCVRGRGVLVCCNGVRGKGQAKLHTHIHSDPYIHTHTLIQSPHPTQKYRRVANVVDGLPVRRLPGCRRLCRLGHRGAYIYTYKIICIRVSSLQYVRTRHTHRNPTTHTQVESQCHWARVGSQTAFYGGGGSLYLGSGVGAWKGMYMVCMSYVCVQYYIAASRDTQGGRSRPPQLTMPPIYTPLQQRSSTATPSSPTSSPTWRRAAGTSPSPVHFFCCYLWCSCHPSFIFYICTQERRMHP